MSGLACTGCGAFAQAACNCGVEYVPTGLRAAAAVAANPGKSDRAIADEIGVSNQTVKRARAKSTVTNVTVDGKRTGKDGKTRRNPAREGRQEETCDGNACDYDWSNPKPADFGDDTTRMYHSQAIHYRTEAGHLASAYPLLAPGVDPEIITKFEIDEAQKVADAWSATVKKLKKLQAKQRTVT